MKSAFVLLCAWALQAQTPAEQPNAEVSAERHAKAVKLVELSRARDRFVAALPDMIERGKTAIQKQCPTCDPAFVVEWGSE